MSTADPSKRCKAETVSISVELAGQRIDNFLFTRLKGIPKTHIYRILRKGEVRVNSGRIGPSYRLIDGDLVRIPPLRRSEAETRPLPPKGLLTTLADAILYEDSHLLILNKPAGVPVHGGSGLSFGVIEALRELWKNDPKRKDIELVHRLDRETSGCLLISKRRSALRALHALLREGNVEKEYWALVKGQWTGKHRVEFSLQKNQLLSGERMVMVREDGLKAVTEFQSLECFSKATLVEAKLLTGRTHQIRVHAATSAHPIAGDSKYGDNDFNRYMKEEGLSRLFLHAKRLSFALPQNGECISIEAPLDQGLTRVLDQLSKETTL